MGQYKYAEIGDTVYFWFAANTTAGAAGDGATPLFDVRLAGAAAGAIPTASGTPTLLTHANYTDGLHEIAIDTTGYAAGEYAVFCTLTISSVNPAGFAGSFKLRTAGTAALAVDTVAISGDATAADNCELMFDGTGYAGGTARLKTDVDTIKTQAVTCAAGVTILASVGTAATSTAQTGDSFPLVSTEVSEIYAAVITNAAGVDIAADIIAVKAETAAILLDTGTTLDGRIPAALTANGNMKCSLMEILTTALTETLGLLAGGFKKFFNVAIPTGTVNSIPDAVAGAAGGIAIVGSEMAANVTKVNGAAQTATLDTIKGDTATIAVDVAGLDGAAMRGTDNAALASVCTEGRLSELDAANLPTDIAARATPAQVNAEVLDVLNVDTFAEPGQEAPAATNTLVKKIGYLFKAWRNRSTQTASQYSLYGDDALTIHHKATFSDDATTADRGEIATGP